MCEHIIKAWDALYESHKNDPATRDLVALGLQHTGQLVGALKTLEMVISSQPGPTGEFPDGQLNEDDEGELQFRMHHSQGNVILEFGKPVAWLALPFDEIPELIRLLANHAEAAEKGLQDPNGEP